MTKARTNADNVTADISGITAGTGLSGGGASGAVTLAIDTATTADLSTAQTLTNKTLAAASNTLTGVINNTLTTTTGDIIYASAANTPARLGIGSTDQVLKVSGGIPAWGAAASFVGCSVYNTANISIANSTATKIAWNAEYYDTNTMHDNSTNNTRITIPSGQGGKYLITTQIIFDANATGERNIQVMKNNVLLNYLDITGVNSGSSYYLKCGAVVLDLAAADYIEIRVSQNSGGTLALVQDSLCQVSKIG